MIVMELNSPLSLPCILYEVNIVLHPYLGAATT